MFLISLCLWTPSPTRAQRFDWASSFSGEDIRSGSYTIQANDIVGSFVDSAGHFYFLGTCSPWASFNFSETRMTPPEIATWPDYRPVVVGKVSPSGDLMWQRFVCDYRQCYAYALQRTGDSSFMVMIGFLVPHDQGDRLFWIDTTLTSANLDYLLLGDSTVSNLTNGFITFDLEGNVQEWHSLEVGYMDSVGRPITMERSWASYNYPQSRASVMVSNILSAETFSVDHQGNIYVVRKTNDRARHVCEPGEWSSAQARDLSIADGNISGLKIMVDGSRALYCPVTQRSALWNQQILKFSPHFDSLLASTYLFDSVHTELGTASTNIDYVTHDSQNNLYLTFTGNDIPELLNLVNSDSLQLKNPPAMANVKCIIKYSPNLRATDILQIVCRDDSSRVASPIYDPYIDIASNTIFIKGGFQWAPWDSPTFHLLHNGIEHPIDTANNMTFWIRAGLVNFNILSRGQVNSTTRPSEMFPIKTSNNRVFTQLKFLNNISFGDTILYTFFTTDYDLGFAVWDYDGHELLIDNYGCSNFYNAPTQLHVMDSAVYLGGVVYDDATFGTHVVPNYGNSTVYIAKYVDTAFMHPYVHPDPRDSQEIIWNQELSFTLDESPVSLTAFSTSGLPVTYICHDTNIAYPDGEVLHLRAEGVTQLTASQEGDGRFFPAEAVTKVLRVGGTGIVSTSRQGVQLYPNPTRDAVWFHAGGERVTEVRVTSSVGQCSRAGVHDNKINLSTLAPGIYYLTIVTDNNIYQHKITKL